MVFFDLRALAHAAQLHHRVARVGLVLGADDRLLIGRRDDAELGELGIGDEVQPDQIGAAFFERGEVLLDGLLRRALEAGGLLARRVADHFVHVGVQLGRRARRTSRRASASSGVHANSLRIDSGCDLS